MRALLATLSALLALSGCLAHPGSSPVTDQSAPATATPDPVAGPADVKVEEGYDLSAGLAETAWSWDVADGATGDLRLSVMGRVVDQVTADSQVCYHWTYQNGGSYSEGRAGNCPNTGGISMSVNPPHLDHETLLKWDALQPGHYWLKVASQPEPNILNVHIVVDNP